jgi:hypothetical protein
MAVSGPLPTARTLYTCVTTALVWGEENNSGDNYTETADVTILGEPVISLRTSDDELLCSMFRAANLSPNATSTFAYGRRQSRRFVPAIGKRQVHQSWMCFTSGSRMSPSASYTWPA